MRIPQIIMGVGLVALAVLLLTPQHHLPRYDPKQEVTLRGTVTDVRDFYCPLSGSEGTHLTLATGNETVEVHVAPSRFLAGKQWQFFRGDEIEVSGARILFHGHPALLARTLRRDTQTLALRDVSGKPTWAN